MVDKGTFSDRLSGLLEKSGESQAALAEAVGVRPQAVSKWLKNGHPNAQTAKRLARHFGVSTGWLLWGDESADTAIREGDEFEAQNLQEIELLQGFRRLSARRRKAMIEFLNPD